MVKKICLTLILLSLFIAIPLAIMGVKKIDLGTGFLWFMQKVDTDLAAWQVKIPNIPIIPKFEDASGWLVVLNFLISVWQGITVVLNIIITIFNYIIQLIQFICTLLFDIGGLIAYALSTGDYDYQWPIV